MLGWAEILFGLSLGIKIGVVQFRDGSFSPIFKFILRMGIIC